MNTKKIAKIVAIAVILGAEVAGSLIWLPKPVSILSAIFLPVVTGGLLLLFPTLWKYPK